MIKFISNLGSDKLQSSSKRALAVKGVVRSTWVPTTTKLKLTLMYLGLHWNKNHNLREIWNLHLKFVMSGGD